MVFFSIHHLQKDNVKFINELTYIKEKIHDDFIILQQMKQKHVQSEINLRMALNEINQLKEENIRFCSQIRRLNPGQSDLIIRDAALTVPSGLTRC